MRSRSEGASAVLRGSCGLPPEDGRAADIALLQANRAAGRLVLAAKAEGGATRLDELVEGGGYRIKFPQPERGLEAVLVNTGGGLLGGDAAAFDVTAGAAADLMVTTQSAEKVYRAVAQPSEIHLTMAVHAAARLHWLPLETILFSGAKLTRRIEADMAGDAELVIAEAVVFGRLAMGEVLRGGMLADRWRIRRGGRLEYAEDMRLEGAISALLDRPAIGGGARAAATVLLMSPSAEARLENARAALNDTAIACGASAWDGKLVVRMLAPDPEPLRRSLSALMTILTGRPAPRFW